jgi:aspartate 1-decarboxylase
VIRGGRNTGEVVLNGTLARLAQIGDAVIILSYTWTDSETARDLRPVIIRVDEKNRHRTAKP